MEQHLRPWTFSPAAGVGTNRWPRASEHGLSTRSPILPLTRHFLQYTSSMLTISIMTSNGSINYDCKGRDRFGNHRMCDLNCVNLCRSYLYLKNISIHFSLRFIGFKLFSSANSLESQVTQRIPRRHLVLSALRIHMDLPFGSTLSPHLARMDADQLISCEHSFCPRTPICVPLVSYCCRISMQASPTTA